MSNLNTSKILRSLAAAAIFAGTLFFAGSPAIADKLHLKDGRVIEGSVVRETAAFVQMKVKVGGVEVVQTFTKGDISKIEKDAASNPAPAPAPTPTPGTEPEVPKADAPVAAADPVASESRPASTDADAKRAERAAERAKQIDSGATRVAILNFGAPSSWQGEIGDMVGMQCNVDSWKRAIPLLEKDKVDVVVVRINSGGGYGFEVPKFNALYENVYKRKFRLVAWVESAISAAAMSPYVIEEIYFMPNGSLGACTGWSGALQNVEGMQLEQMLAEMEVASELGKRSPAIMRAMQIQVPLSASIDPTTGEVTWFQDTSGQHLLNPANQILTLTANDAVKFKFARGIAATKEELAKAMGLNEVVWAGEEATRFIDENMRATDRTDKRWQLKYQEYELNAGFAEGSQERSDRGKFVGKAIAALRELRSMFATNPNFGMLYDINDEWFRVREEELRKLLREDR